MLFHQVEGAVCILRSKGVFKQVDVFVRGDALYAKWGGGFIGLRRHENGTTVPTVRWEHIEGVGYAFEGLGIMVKKPNIRAAANG